MIQGDVAIIKKEASHHPFKVGQEVIIFRKCIDGYKVTGEAVISRDEIVEWYYVEAKDLDKSHDHTENI